MNSRNVCILYMDVLIFHHNHTCEPFLNILVEEFPLKKGGQILVFTILKEGNLDLKKRLVLFNFMKIPLIIKKIGYKKQGVFNNGKKSSRMHALTLYSIDIRFYVCCSRRQLKTL